jgi:hypothetical protein
MKIGFQGRGNKHSGQFTWPDGVLLCRPVSCLRRKFGVRVSGAYHEQGVLHQGSAHSGHVICKFKLVDRICCAACFSCLRGARGRTMLKGRPSMCDSRDVSLAGEEIAVYGGRLFVPTRPVLKLRRPEEQMEKKPWHSDCGSHNVVGQI